MQVASIVQASNSNLTTLDSRAVACEYCSVWELPSSAATVVDPLPSELQG